MAGPARSDLLEEMDAGLSADTGVRVLASVAGLILAVALIVVVTLVGQSNRRRDEAVSRERHSYEVMLLTTGIAGSIGRAEEALGRFVINPRDQRKVASTYYGEWVAAGRQVDQLRRVTAADPAQRRDMDRLRRLFERRGRELSGPAGHANYRQYVAALSTYSDVGRSVTIPALARTLARIEGRERATLADRAAQTRAAGDQADMLIAALSIFGLGVVVLALTLGWLIFAALAANRRSRENADEQSDRAGWLEVAVAERTAELSAANLRLKTEMAERAAAEMQLRQVQKMEAVGQLTGGIAHDFNNMLAVVVGGLDLARRRLRQETDEVGRHIDNAMEGANRAAALTRRLLSFARAEPLLPRATDPGALIGGMSDLLDRTLGERIAVTTRGLDGLWPVWVDGHQLENAILNLAVNARDAMDGEGRVLIGGANLTLAAGEVGDAAAGDHVCISVVDDGCGMTREVIERAYEPFFTTKPVGKGTGLGLSQIFGFVRQSGGEIAIDSVVGAGTVVSLYLPRHVAAAAAVAPEIAPAEPVRIVRPPRGPSPEILVVEDDVRVLRATMDGLAELGYAAIACGGGEEALVRLATTPSIRLLVTDVVMPAITGPELVRRVRPLFPDIAVLFVTGYVGEAGEAGDLAGHQILRKPFTLAALDRAVAGALAAAAAAVSAPPRPGSAAAAG